MRIILIRMNQIPPPPIAFASASTHAQTNSPTPSSVLDSSVDSREPRKVTSEMLLAGSKELVIKHAGRDYHLRLTKLGKLILTA